MLRRLALALAVSAAAGCPSDPAAVPDAAYGVCADELDNDGDGSIDFPADPGCNSLADNDEANAPIAACHDGRDNDGDGAIDYPDDPGCYTVLQASEVDDCPDGPTCPACGNGVDDDDDGLVDFPDDPGCVAASDDEFSVDPNACGPGLLVQLVQGGATGTVPGTPSNLASPTCGGGGGEAAYQVSFTEPSVLVATTDLPGTSMDTVLYLRTDCLDPATELACNNNTGEPGVTTSRIVATLDPGTYYLVVDADNAASGGTYQLQVDLLRGEGQACANQGECGPGLQCRTPMGETAMICAQPVCNDADDEDGDTLAGYPDDPGCVDALDFDEADDCPSGPACPMCGNGVDDEGDGAIDYPDDPDCVAASTPVEGCSQESDPVLPMTGASLSGDTSDATDNFWSTCGFEGKDEAILVQLPAMQVFHVDNIGTSFDAVLILHDQSCANELACSDSFPNESLDVTNLAAGTYMIIIDGWFNAAGPWTVNIGGAIAPGGACDGALATAGVIGCGAGYGCVGGICVGTAECNNGVDDDGDGAPGFPTDPGCASPIDATEADDCPAGPGCPQCGNIGDDDGDGDVDYPADADCASASDDDESPPACVQEQDPIETIVGGTTTGSTVGTSNDFVLSCDFSFSQASGEVVLTLDLPAMESVSVDQLGTSYDAILGLFEPTCANELGCADFGGIDLVNVAAGTYSVVMDGWGGAEGPYTVNVSGVIAPLGACDGVLASSGAIGCPVGYTCSGGFCLGAEQCNNGVDDDGDGEPGYPSDPGCAEANDSDETDACPSGPSCPQCGNGVDDDGDGLADYPADPSCTFAGATSEALCGSQETSPITPVVIPLYAGTTIGGADDFVATCGFAAGEEDRTYALTLPVPVETLTVHTIGSSIETVLSVTDSGCNELACNHHGAGNAAIIVMNGLPAGAYGIVVDGWFNSGSYQLEVRGTVPPGAACTDPHFATGVLSCPANHLCAAGTCQPL